MGTRNYKIGQVASRLEVSVRTLRRYDEIGLLTPAFRASTGHRLYTEAELARLQKIVALRKMGFALEHIRSVLSGDTAKAFKTLEGHATRLRLQISKQQGVLKSVEGVLDFRDMHSQFTKAEMDEVKKRSEEVGTALVKEMERGSDPKSPHVQELVREMQRIGKEMLKSFGGSAKMSERMEWFKHNRHLIPQGDPSQMAEMQEKMRKLTDYLRRAKA